MVKPGADSNEYRQVGVNATNVIVSTLGTIFGISGIVHGYFELLQGNSPTEGMIINAIGEANRLWLYGTEPAFTLIPNFMATGIAAILISIFAIIWSICFVHTRNGPLVFLLLFITLFLVGGGIGQVIFFTINWAAATRINKPFTWWQRLIPVDIRKPFQKLWTFCLASSSILLLFALEIAVYGYVPGTGDPDRVTKVMLLSLGGSLILYLLSLVSGSVHDMERPKSNTGFNNKEVWLR